MRAERTADVVARWVRFYTRDLPVPVALRRVEEIDADLYDQISHERASGTSDPRIAVGLLSRMVRGVGSDVTWRREQTGPATDRRSRNGGPMTTSTIPYRFGFVVALGTALLLAWGVLAMGVIGAEGDPFDLLYIGVLAIGIVGAVIARFRPRGMARALLAMAAAQLVVTVIALLVGKQEVRVSSLAEIVGLNGFFIALFAGSAWLFNRAAEQPRGSGGLRR